MSDCESKVDKGEWKATQGLIMDSKGSKGTPYPDVHAAQSQGCRLEQSLWYHTTFAQGSSCLWSMNTPTKGTSLILSYFPHEYDHIQFKQLASIHHGLDVKQEKVGAPEFSTTLCDQKVLGTAARWQLDVWDQVLTWCV